MKTLRGLTGSGLPPFLGLVLVGSLAAGCATAPAQAAEFAAASNVSRGAASDDAARLAASALDGFAFELYAKLGQGNLVYSPASVALALAMARPGARGETATEMDKVLHSLGAPDKLSQINSLDLALDALNVKDPKGGDRSVMLRIANAQFAQRGYAFEQAYLEALASAFGDGARLVDYGQPETARKTINSWVSDQTEKRIPELIPAGLIDSSARLTLVNAIYLKAAWLEQFTASSTATAGFTTPDGTAVQVPMMSGFKEDALYGEGSGWRAVELPYVGGSLAMTIVVPDDLTAFEKTLDTNAWSAITAALQARPVQLRMPKFKLETKARLESQLAALGMPAAFDPGKADFSGMTTAESLYISFVIHQANIDVDENGTVASAATAVGMRASGMAAQPVSLNVDRPFLFAIRDRGTGAIVFLGRVTDPRS